MADPASSSARRVLPLLGLALALAHLSIGGWILLTRWEVLRSAHPALLVLVLVVIALGLLHGALALRGAGVARRRAATDADDSHADSRKRRGVLAVTGRVAMVLLSIVLLAATTWLRPFPADAEALSTLDRAKVELTSTATTITLHPAAGSTAAPSGASETEKVARTGLLFQPGARVDPRAYVPMLSRVAEAGYTVVIVKQPLQIGFLATGAHRAIIDQHPEIDQWVLAGHSLGGVVASLAVEDPDVDALVLWASYPAGPLDVAEGIPVTSISGTADGLTTPQDISAARADLPADTRYVVIDGAVHAFFGDYGTQPGDGEPGISRAAAQEQIIAATVATLDELASQHR